MQPDHKKYLLSATFLTWLVLVAFFGSYAGMNSDRPTPTAGEGKVYPPQDPNKGGAGGPQDDQSRSAPTIVVKLLNTGHSAAETAQAADEQEKKSANDRMLLWLTGGLGFMAVLQWAVYVWQATITRDAVKETRRIGEAQVRAYVNTRYIEIRFIDELFISPMVAFVLFNSGQSPARNLIWNVALQYDGEGRRRKAILTEKWLSGIGMDIQSSGESAPYRAIIPNMSIRQYWEDFSPTIRMPVIRGKIDFRYTDVFERDHFGEVYFVGLIERVQDAPEGAVPGGSQWRAQVSTHPKPTDWDDA